jgi:hypothetical protein
MQAQSPRGRLLREVRPSWHLFATYGVLAAAGALTLGWLRYSGGVWKWLLVLTGLFLPVLCVAAALVLWGLWGTARLWRHRLRLYEGGLYQGPRSGRAGGYLDYGQVSALVLDVVRFPPPIEPLIGHYRVIGPDVELLLYPKLYPDTARLADEISSRTGLSWTELPLSRGAARQG